MPQSDLRSLGYFAVIVWEIVGFTGAGVGIGYYAFSHWGAPWWVLLMTSMGGLVVAMYRLYKMTERDMGSDGREKTD
jgi:hypothetical protein